MDLLALEMMQDVRHAALACEAAAATGLPWWLGVSCRLRADGALVAFDFADTELATVLDALLPFAPAAVRDAHAARRGAARALARSTRLDGARGAYPEIEPT